MEEPKKELIITRTFDAPVGLVWKAWTDQSLIKKWWGPNGVTNPTCVWDARPGGEIYIVMLAGKELGPVEGTKWPMKGTFKEVTPKKMIVFVGGALDDVDRSSDTFIEQLITVDFEDLGKKTKMNLHLVVTKVVGPKAPAALQGMSYGWNQQTDKLAAMLIGMAK
jgi:uncharacterized protein YndB with AHSA1/START domain